MNKSMVTREAYDLACDEKDDMKAEVLRLRAVMRALLASTRQSEDARDATLHTIEVLSKELET